MIKKDKEVRPENCNLDEINVRILGQIMAAQNVLFVLPTRKKIVSFLTELLSIIPGVNACHVCFGFVNSKEKSSNPKRCITCKMNKKNKGENTTIAKEFSCELESLPNTFVIPSETMDYRFGFFIFFIEKFELFALYKPFIYNLGNFVALMLENRLQKDDLLNIQNLLEFKVEERTKELQLMFSQDKINRKLNKAINTARLQAEEALFTSQQVFRTLVENLPDLIVRYDCNYKRTYVNPAFLRESKIPEQELLASTPAQRSPLTKDGVRILQNLLKKALEEGIADSADIFWPKEDNSEHWYNVVAYPEFDRKGKVVSVMTISRDITVRKQIEQERLAHLRFFECMDKINKAIQGTNNLEKMMSDVLDVVITVFNCDRAFLLYPCDPDADSWTSPMERNKPEYPGILNLNLKIPMDTEVAETFRILLRADGPVQFGPGSPYALPKDVADQFNLKCFMSMALYPKVGTPWQFGIHQCSHVHIWTNEEIRLFREIGRRLEDSITSLQTYRDLVASEQRYRMVFENSPVSIWEEDLSEIMNLFNHLRKNGVTDIKTYFDQNPDVIQMFLKLMNIVDVNFSALTLHAAKSKEELVNNLANVFTPESLKTLIDELVCLWNGGTEMSSDSIIKTLNGELRNVTIYFLVCPGYEETLSKVLVSIIDITERKKTEEALMINEERFRMAQTISHVGNWEYNLNTTHFWGSDEAKRIYGFDPYQSNFTTDEVESCIPEREMAHQALIDLIEKNKEYNLEFEIHPVDSSAPKIITSVAKLLRDENGNPLKVVGVIQDITERKKVEEEILRLNQELEERVAKRTAQLEAVNKELEAFAYSVSHDLRAPLRHINGFMKLFIEQNAHLLDTKSQSYIDHISDASKRMGTLIDDLLSFSRMGRLEMSTRQINLQILVQEIIQEMAPDYAGRTIHWQISDLPTVTGDRSLLRVVLVNLIANAIKFTKPREQTKIEISHHTSETEVIIFVRDNGVGFDPDYTDKLFGVFKRLHRTEEFEGTGIGLANVRRIIERHGGRAWAEGFIDKGATFYFSLPIVKQ